MNRRLKRILQSLVVNDAAWIFLSPFVYAGKRLALSRENYINRKSEDENAVMAANIFSKKIVLHGLFKGMVYNDIKATGSSIYAKLLGSYEMELAPYFEKMFPASYGNLINIGCDEGYYAVGLARLSPLLKVTAFDCNKTAREKCKALALLNGVQDRVTVKGCFSINDLDLSDKQSKCLFIIDCEGCENEIIDARLLKIFAKSDFIIELHYQQNPLVFLNLSQLFAATHTLTLVNAFSDHERIMNYKFPELENLHYDQINYIVKERNNYLQWLIAEPVHST